MTDTFAQLTERGQQRRLYQSAREALKAYKIKVDKIRLLKYGYNAVFQVDTSDRKRYVFRIHVPNLRTPANMQAEMNWLADINQTTDIPVPKPIKNKQGDLIHIAQVKGMEKTCPCVLMTYLDGRHQRSNASDTMIRKMGARMAQLHNHAESYQPTEKLDLPLYNRIWHFNADKSPLYEYPDKKLIPAKRRKIIREASDQAEAFLKELYKKRKGRHIIHADLHLGNVKLLKGEVQVFDFDDCGIGYFIQDLGISFYYLTYLRNFGERLYDIWLEGYAQVRDTSNLPLELLPKVMIHRELQVTHYLVQSENARFKPMLPSWMARSERLLRGWLKG